MLHQLATVWWWHASSVESLQYDDDMHHWQTQSLQCDDGMHHRCTSCNVMMTCITVVLPALWWWHASPLHSLQYDELVTVWPWHASPLHWLQCDDDMHHWLMDSLQCVDNMHHYGSNIIKGLATAFQLPAGKSWGRYLQTHLFCYGNNRPGGGSLSATLEF